MQSAPLCDEGHVPWCAHNRRVVFLRSMSCSCWSMCVSRCFGILIGVSLSNSSERFRLKSWVWSGILGVMPSFSSDVDPS
jgi:hypothetical protein